MSVRFIQQSIDKQRQFFIGHYDDLNQCWRINSFLLGNVFTNTKHVQSTLMKQGWVSLLCDDFNLEYRIEVD